jgi:hypothetical protein
VAATASPAAPVPVKDGVAPLRAIIARVNTLHTMVYSSSRWVTLSFLSLG